MTTFIIAEIGINHNGDLELAKEMKLLMENLNLEKTIFRSDHASNHLVLKGILGRDKERLIGEISQSIMMSSDLN